MIRRPWFWSLSLAQPGFHFLSAEDKQLQADGAKVFVPSAVCLSTSHSFSTASNCVCIKHRVFPDYCWIRVGLSQVGRVIKAEAAAGFKLAHCSAGQCVEIGSVQFVGNMELGRE